jgi:importin-7
MVFFPGGHTESKKQSEEDGDDMDGFDADEEYDEEVDSDKEMGLDDEDGDEATSSQLQKLAAEVCGPLLFLHSWTA